GPRRRSRYRSGNPRSSNSRRARPRQEMRSLLELFRPRRRKRDASEFLRALPGGDRRNRARQIQARRRRGITLDARFDGRAVAFRAAAEPFEPLSGRCLLTPPSGPEVAIIVNDNFPRRVLLFFI